MLNTRKPPGRSSAWRWAFWAAVMLALAPPTAADWLITLEGRLIETAGPWTTRDGSLTYTDLDGEEHTLDLDAVDLEASEETTALKAGKTYDPNKGNEDSPQDVRGGKRRKTQDKKPKIILYMTSLCKECTRTRELLEELDVAFVEKDINTNKKAGREYRKKAGHGGGLPVLDIDGAMVFSNNPKVIRQRVREMLERQAQETPTKD